MLLTSSRLLLHLCHTWVTWRYSLMCTSQDGKDSHTHGLQSRSGIRLKHCAVCHAPHSHNVARVPQLSTQLYSAGADSTVLNLDVHELSALAANEQLN